MPRHVVNPPNAEEALLSFALWVKFGLKQSIQNVVELKRANPPGIKNPVLTFVVPRVMNYVVERFVLEVCQAWELLSAQLKRKGLRSIGVSHKDYRHLKRIRNKLVAHKIENNLKTRRHEAWYKRTYGNYVVCVYQFGCIASEAKNGSKWEWVSVWDDLLPCAASSRCIRWLVG